MSLSAAMLRHKFVLFRPCGKYGCQLLTVVALVLGPIQATPSLFSRHAAAASQSASPASATGAPTMGLATQPTVWVDGDNAPHAAVWLAWATSEYKRGFSALETTVEMIRAMAGHVNVALAVEDAAEEASVRAMARKVELPLSHVRFYTLPHAGGWFQDNLEFVYRNGTLGVPDWGFTMWGYEEADSPESGAKREARHRIAEQLQMPLYAVPANHGHSFTHEGGSVAHNGFGTMIAVESVVMQRNLGPRHFCAGLAPVNDFASPTTYAPHADWETCKRLTEAVYRDTLGVRKVIWLPTGVSEDQGTFRGPLATHIQVPAFAEQKITHPGVYTMFTTNGHADDFVRFTSKDHVVLAEVEVTPLPAQPTPVQRLINFLETQNARRLDTALAILQQATTADGEALRITRLPMPELILEVLAPGDSMYAYFAGYTNWEGPSPPLGQNMLCVLPTSYANYVETNDMVLVPQYGEADNASAQRDRRAATILSQILAKPAVGIPSRAANLGGGGPHCLSRPQPKQPNSH